jgi:hypothetical protein
MTQVVMPMIGLKSASTGLESWGDGLWNDCDIREG